MLPLLIFLMVMVCVQSLRAPYGVGTRPGASAWTLRASEVKESPLTVVQREKEPSEPRDEENISLARGGSAQLRSLLESMPLTDKYSLLLQSYAGSIMDRSASDAATVLKSMESLYTEMLCLSIKPGEPSARSMLNAASAFCNSGKLAEVMQLVKAGGYLKAFGVLNAQLTKPLVSASVESKARLADDVVVPSDNREQEVFFASILVGTASIYAALQLLGHTVVDDLKPWATLVGLLAVLSGLADVGLRQGVALKAAAAGVDRLVLSDAEREYHSESAAFLAGYLLGLPCFCFQPEVSEAVKMLRDSPGSLSAYKQPLARISSGSAGKGSRGSSSSGKGGGLFQDLLAGMQTRPSNDKGGSAGVAPPGGGPATGDGSGGMLNGIMKSTGLALRGEEVEETYQVSKETVKDALIDTDSITAADLTALGRVLVWMMSPVAAEMQRYGKTIVSDPRRGRRLLDVLEAIQTAERGDLRDAVDPAAAQSLASRLPHLDIPASEEDKEVLLRWAYYEADTLLKQYGDLVVDVGDYLGSGTSSVGEVVALLEQEMNM